MLFDLDGTLVDSNGAHVEAWRRAFAGRGYRVPPDRIFVEIGKGGDKVVPHLLGNEADEKDGDALRRRAQEYARIAKAHGLKPMPGAVSLLTDLRRRGIKTVLATSSKKGQLQITVEASGVDWPALVDELTTADDAERSKPDPDIVSAAVKKLKLTPAQCAMVGDTPYDAESARRAGIICLGVTCGGHSQQKLVSSGARAGWRDPADLLAHLDEALKLASPGTVHLTQDALESLMHQALAAAREGMATGEVPIGAVLACGDGTVVARGYNRLNATGNKTAHAEIDAFARAAGKIPPEARDAVLVSTLEPCVMCLGAAMIAAVDTVIFGLRSPADRGTSRVRPPQSPQSQMPRIIGDVLADKSRALFKEWIAKPNRDPQQVAFVKQLLELT